MNLEKRFTRSDLIVIFVVLIAILFFMQFFHPRGRSIELARRVQCASNLGALGRAFVMYQGEYNDKLPCPWTTPNGSFGSGLYNKPGEFKITRFADPDWNDYENVQTVGMCLYLLVRFENTDPKSFICPSADNDLEMMFEDIDRFSRGKFMFWRDLQDFQSMANLSYSYHDPWSAYEIDENNVILADKNNAYDTDTGAQNVKAGDFPIQNKDGSWDDDNGKNPRHGNSRNHQGQCQNVLFANWRVKKFETPYVGIARDNIYTYWTKDRTASKYRLIGRWDKGHSQNRLDSYLGN